VLANVTPGHKATWVNYRNDDRAPLMLLAGGKDNIMPAAVNKENAQRYEKSAAHTDYYEFADRDTTPSARPTGRGSPTTPAHGRPTTHPGAGASSRGAAPRRPDLLSEMGRQTGDAGRVAAGVVCRCLCDRSVERCATDRFGRATNTPAAAGRRRRQGLAPACCRAEPDRCASIGEAPATEPGRRPG
jgi:hypothetical protein